MTAATGVRWSEPLAAKPGLVILPDAEALARAAKDWFVEQVGRNSGRIAVCLTGGSTPERLYRLLAQEKLPWERMHFFWSDERFVPPGRSAEQCADGAARAARPRAGAFRNHEPDSGVDVGTAARARRFTRPTLKRFYGAETLDPEQAAFRRGSQRHGR